jgi:7-cyano-7-deazaguanine reductase
MTTYQNAKELAQLTLGKSTSYTTQYTPSLLQAVPRSLNRDDLAITTSSLPFIGEDVWYGYELSWLNKQGKPVVAVAEFRFACTSPNLVESKSFKLYLNSFNQTNFDDWQQVEAFLSKDLTACSGAFTKVKLYKVDNCPALALAHSTALCLDEIELTTQQYSYQADLLNDIILEEQTDIVEESLVSHLLKSNCLITNQPDWASIYINYRGKQISHTVLLKYLISFRQHNEFHEQCVERIFCDLQKYGQFEQLSIFARYTRRGGLDINPFRSTHLKQAPNLRTIRQ